MSSTLAARKAELLPAHAARGAAATSAGAGTARADTSEPSRGTPSSLAATLATGDRAYKTDEQLLEAFHLFDRNGDGYITLDELDSVFAFCGQHLPPAKLEAHLKHADANKDGKLGAEEFATLLKRFNGTWEDVVNKLRHVYATMAGDDKLVSLERAREALAPVLALVGHENEAAVRVLAEADANSDGHLSYEEFKRILFGVPSGRGYQFVHHMAHYCVGGAMGAAAASGSGSATRDSGGSRGGGGDAGTDTAPLSDADQSQLDAMLAHMKRDHGLDIVWNESIAAKDPTRDLSGGATPPWMILAAMPWLLEEIALYPASLLRTMREKRIFNKIIVLKGAMIAGNPAGGGGYIQRQALVINCYSIFPNREAVGSTNVRYRIGVREAFKHIFHHELFHLIDYVDDATSLRAPGGTDTDTGEASAVRGDDGLGGLHDAEWEKLNRMGWLYANERVGADGLTDYGQLNVTCLDMGSATEPGFVNGYCQAAVIEDKAEVFGTMVFNAAALDKLCSTDAIVAAKVQRMRELTIRFCPDMTPAWWARPELRDWRDAMKASARPK